MRGRALLAGRHRTRASITDDEVYLVLVRYASTVPVPTVRVTSLCRNTYTRNVDHRDIYNRLVALERAGLAYSLSWLHDHDELTRLGLDGAPLSPREQLARHWAITRPPENGWLALG